VKTLGKVVCVHASIATDTGPAMVNGRPDEGVRRMLTDDGATWLVLDRVVSELSTVTRRRSFGWRPPRETP
jgi:hypothetical protein